MQVYRIGILTILDSYLTEIEKEFIDELKDLKTIRENRFIDKLLWTGE